MPTYTDSSDEQPLNMLRMSVTFKVLSALRSRVLSLAQPVNMLNNVVMPAVLRWPMFTVLSDEQPLNTPKMEVKCASL